MKKVHGLIVLETEEEIRKFFNCKQHEFIDAEPDREYVNPNGEFVVGYGYSPVFVEVIKEEYCKLCGFKRRKQ